MFRSLHVEFCLGFKFILADLHGNFRKRGDPNIQPPNTMILILGTPERVPLILGNPHILLGLFPVFSFGLLETAEFGVE